ncbi:MAG: FAD-dependent oxidoreductase [Sulfolobales archaeon]|nr:FAD-dependent oxidoreductase [Sulfolobales archaeon]
MLFEGQSLDAYEGESIAIALYASGVDTLSWSPNLGRARGAFCMIGKCSSCFMKVNGLPNVKTCREPVKDGLVIERQAGWISPDTNNEESSSVELREIDVDVLVVGGGPAGLSAALKASEYGLDVAVVDEHFKIGGQLLKQTHKFFGNVELFGGMRGFQIAEEYSKKLKSSEKIRVLTRSVVYGVFRGGLVGVIGENTHYVVKPKVVVGSTGAAERYLDFLNNDLPGVVGAGGVQTIMNEYGVKPGESALVVGSGNVGLIVAYQLLQAGVAVRAIVEILPEVGGWFVHAAKVRRYGVPILLQHTVKAVYGDGRVREVEVVAVDENFNPVPGSEKRFKVDLVLLAVGLEPDTRFFSQCGAVMKWSPELGGLVPLRTLDLETSVRNLYIAGDASGIEEATTAIMEGQIAALSAVSKLADRSKAGRAEEEMEKICKFLWEDYRTSPVLARARRGKQLVTVSREEMEKIRVTYPPRVSFG